MHLYVLIPMVSCVLSAVLLGSIFRRGPAHRANQLVSVVLAGGVVFSFAETILAGIDDPTWAIGWVRFATLGWVFAGPIALQLLLEVTGAPALWARRMLPAFYSVSAALLALGWSTPWIHRAVQSREWGWAYETGPLFPFQVGFQVALVALAIGIGLHHYRKRRLNAEIQQSWWIAIGLTVVIAVGVVSHLDVQASFRFPRTGSLSFLLLSALIVGTLQRFGYWILAPGAFERQILATIPTGVMLLHEDGRVRIANDGMAQLMRCEPSELLGLPIDEKLSRPVAASNDIVRELECELRTCAGPLIPVSVSVTRIRDKRGLDLGKVMVVADLREVVDLRNRLITSGRLAAVGELAAGVAHEINNPLTYVRANLSMLRQEWDALRSGLADETSEKVDLLECLAETEELIDESLEGVDRAAAIVRDVKNFSHAGRAERELADLEPLLDSVLRVAAPQLGESIRVVKQHGTLPMVTCAPQELKQVFLNLVVNAAHAMPDGGAITLSSALEGEDVVVRISDEGHGIRPEDQERIFDPFFTTKPVGEGTGLGLALSYEIVRRHGGEIRVDSTAGRGATFTVSLPVEGPHR